MGAVCGTEVLLVDFVAEFMSLTSSIFPVNGVMVSSTQWFDNAKRIQTCFELYVESANTWCEDQKCGDKTHTKLILEEFLEPPICHWAWSWNAKSNWKESVCQNNVKKARSDTKFHTRGRPPHKKQTLHNHKQWNYIQQFLAIENRLFMIFLCAAFVELVLTCLHILESMGWKLPQGCCLDRRKQACMADHCSHDFWQMFQIGTIWYFWSVVCLQFFCNLILQSSHAHWCIPLVSSVAAGHKVCLMAFLLHCLFCWPMCYASCPLWFQNSISFAALLCFFSSLFDIHGLCDSPFASISFSTKI